MSDADGGGSRERSPAVAWYAGGRAEEHPVAIRVAGAWRRVTVESSVLEVGQERASPTRRVFVVRDEGGRRYRVVAVEDAPAPEVEPL